MVCFNILHLYSLKLELVKNVYYMQKGGVTDSVNS